MNGKAQESQPQIKYPCLETPSAGANIQENAAHQPPVMPGDQKPKCHRPYNDESGKLSSSFPNQDKLEVDEKWGTHVMGTPAVPTCHPDNQKAALWGAADQKQYQYNHHPYLQYSPVERTNPMGSVLHKFNSWSRKAEATANNIWHNLKTGPSVPGAAWAKANLTAKAITGGGFDSLYKQTFTTFPNEKLKKTFASYLSTATGPVAGTLYLSDFHVAFCSDRPLSFTAPSGQQTWSYYKILIPTGNIASINPVVMKENSTERYIQLLTVDGQDFWFMGFVNYEKACHHLFESTTSSSIAVSGLPVKPVVA